MDSPPVVQFRPQLLQVPAFLALALFFGALWVAAQQVGAPVDVSCRRQNGQTSCQVVTPQWPSPTVIQLSPTELADVSFEVVPLPQDRSYKKIELRRGSSTRLLVDFTDEVRARHVADVNDFLRDGVSNQVSARIVEPDTNVTGLLLLLVLAAATFGGSVFSLARVTSFACTGGRLQVRARRWPLPPVTQQIDRSEIAEVLVVSRIPDRLAPIVASLPWRNIYRANALAVRSINGDERLLSDFSKRGRALHERTAAAVRELLTKTAAPI